MTEKFIIYQDGRIWIHKCDEPLDEVFRTKVLLLVGPPDFQSKP